MARECGQVYAGAKDGPRVCTRGAGHDNPHRGPLAPGAWDRDVEQALESIGEQVGAAVQPLALALQEARTGAAVTLDHYAQVYAALAAVVALLDRGGARGNWAPDQAILDTARELVARLSPIPPTTGADDDRIPQ